MTKIVIPDNTPTYIKMLVKGVTDKTVKYTKEDFTYNGVDMRSVLIGNRGPNIEEAEAIEGLDFAMALAYRTEQQAGWNNDPDTGEPFERNFGEQIALIHSELSEALEGHRKGIVDHHLPHRNNVEVELADALVRIFAMARRLGYDLPSAFIEKNRYNQQRADHKMKNRNKIGGKRY